MWGGGVGVTRGAEGLFTGGVYRGNGSEDDRLGYLYEKQNT